MSGKADFYAVRLQNKMIRVIYPLVDVPKIKFNNIEYKENVASRLPDLRYLLYWEPRVRTSRTPEITFFTSDVSGIYEIVVSGYVENGDWLELKHDFVVK